MGVFNVRRCNTLDVLFISLLHVVPLLGSDSEQEPHCIKRMMILLKSVEIASKTEDKVAQNPVGDSSKMGRAEHGTRCSCWHEPPFSDQKGASKIGDSVLWVRVADAGIHAPKQSKLHSNNGLVTFCPPNAKHLQF
jgi:hypothetical protein